MPRLSVQSSARSAASLTGRPEVLSHRLVMELQLTLGVRVDDVVERVALDGLASGCADELLELARRHRLGRARAGHVVDLLFLHGAVEIVDAEPERRLRDL